MSHFNSAETLRRAIWCEIFVVREGYILYLKEWYKKSLKPKMNQQMLEVDETHSDIQGLVLGNPVN